MDISRVCATLTSQTVTISGARMNQLKNWLKIFKILDENKKRWFAAEKTLDIGRGGVSSISKLTGMSRTTITKGISELLNNKKLTEDRVREIGGGRKSIQSDKKLILEIEKIINDSTAGHPMNALKWTAKTSRNIVDELKKHGHNASHTTVCNILNGLDYSLKSNRKILNPKQDPNRDEQFLISSNKCNTYLVYH